MPRRPRNAHLGRLYHVINRGNRGVHIFAEDRTKQIFENTLFEACDRARWRLHAFCIVENRYHLAIEVSQANLTEGMRWLQSVFANCEGSVKTSHVGSIQNQPL